MPAPLKHPTLALIGLAIVGLLCVQLLRNAITLETAAFRSIIAVVVLVLCDRIAMPIGRALLGASGPREAASAAADAAPTEGQVP